METLALEGPPAVQVVIDAIAQTEQEDSSNVIAYYGIKITTTAGRCTIDFRNSSNGYYGGSMEVVQL